RRGRWWARSGSLSPIWPRRACSFIMEITGPSAIARCLHQTARTYAGKPILRQFFVELDHRLMVGEFGNVAKYRRAMLLHPGAEFFERLAIKQRDHLHRRRAGGRADAMQYLDALQSVRGHQR